jgi:hypothetical protein
MLTPKNIMPFMGVEFDQVVGDYRVITYQAYNAMGLIGSECNGIAILSEKNRDVVLDEYCKQSSGYCGVGHAVIKKAIELCELIKTDFDTFREFVNENPRARYEI